MNSLDDAALTYAIGCHITLKKHGSEINVLDDAALERERDASAVSVYEEAPGFRRGPRWMTRTPARQLLHQPCHVVSPGAIGPWYLTCSRINAYASADENGPIWSRSQGQNRHIT